MTVDSVCRFIDCIAAGILVGWAVGHAVLMLGRWWER
jgi:hypothetical protein